MVRVQLFLGHSVDEANFDESEDEVVQSARKAADKECKPVGEGSPGEHLAWESKRGYEEEMMKVVCAREPKTSNHVINVHAVDDGKRPHGGVSKERFVEKDGGVSRIDRVGENGPQGPQRREAHKQIGECVDEKPPRHVVGAARVRHIVLFGEKWAHQHVVEDRKAQQNDSIIPQVVFPTVLVDVLEIKHFFAFDGSFG